MALDTGRFRWPGLVSVVLTIDAVLSLGFGFVSYVSPHSTYATIVDLRAVPDDSLVMSILGSLSVFYVVIGAVCLLAAFTPSPHDVGVAVVMMGQHVWIGLRGADQMSRAWIVGDPWPDLIIHALFVIAYSTGVVRRLRQPHPP
jgi:hypothetical protein